MHPSMILKCRTVSQEIRHQNQFLISQRRDIVYYSERKQQNLLKLPILGGPNQEYYQRQIEKTQKQIERVELQQSKMKSKMSSHQKQFDKMSKQMKKIKKSINNFKMQEDELEQKVKKIEEVQPGQKNMLRTLNTKINQIKDQISNLQQAKNRIQFNIQIESNSYNRHKERIKCLDKQSDELCIYLLKLQSNERGPHWTYMK